MGDPAFPKDVGKGRVVDVIKPRLDLLAKGGHFQGRPLQSFHVGHEGQAGIVCAQPREGTALVRVNEPP